MPKLAANLSTLFTDRSFLDRTITSVLELDEHTHGASEYAGGWSAYLAERETARRHAEEDYATFVNRRAVLRGRSQEQRQWSVLHSGFLVESINSTKCHIVDEPRSN